MDLFHTRFFSRITLSLFITLLQSPSASFIIYNFFSEITSNSITLPHIVDIHAMGVSVCASAHMLIFVEKVVALLFIETF